MSHCQCSTWFQQNEATRSIASTLPLPHAPLDKTLVLYTVTHSKVLLVSIYTPGWRETTCCKVCFLKKRHGVRDKALNKNANFRYDIHYFNHYLLQRCISGHIGHCIVWKELILSLLNGYQCNSVITFIDLHLTIIIFFINVFHRMLKNLGNYLRPSWRKHYHNKLVEHTAKCFC